MVTIVAGKINSGKTTFLLNHYQKQQSGDGFIAIKRMEGKSVYCFALLRLSTNSFLPWMVHQDFYDDEFEDVAKFGPYALNLTTLRQVETTLEELIARKVSPLYLDEVGVLELNGGGYHDILKKMVKSGLDLYITVRSDLVKPVIAYFQISEPVLITVQREE
ncbi:MAG: nucleoside-triphosphatase [Bacilli bacterium]|jgi:nucleoside-triphosphatase THEP1